jgi:hypothetical protein
VRIVYGMPTPAIVARARRGEIALGGCEVFEGEPMPTLRCKACALDFAPVVIEPEAT